MPKRKIHSTTEYSFTVLYDELTEGGYHITVPSLPGLVSYGRTFDEARVMARDAIVCHVEALKKDRSRVPQERSMLQERLTISA